MKYFRTLSFLFLSFSFVTTSHAYTEITVTLDTSTLKQSVGFQGCAKITSVAPGSATYTFDSNGAFVENIDGNLRNGYWTEIDDKYKKFRLTYSGNAPEGTGDWDDYADAIDNLADIACDGAAMLRPSLIIKKFELSITPMNACAGKAKVTFQAEAYGFNPDYDAYGKGSHKWSGSGTFVDNACI